jgi:hypothetical protein
MRDIKLDLNSYLMVDRYPGRGVYLVEINNAFSAWTPSESLKIVTIVFNNQVVQVHYDPTKDDINEFNSIFTSSTTATPATSNFTEEFVLKLAAVSSNADMVTKVV